MSRADPAHVEAGCLERLCGSLLEAAALRVAVVVAHPDDEVIGAGARLAYLEHPWIIHVTDGAPRDLRDATRCGFGSRRAYAEARRQEALEALSLAGIAPSQVLELELVDQEAAHQLVDLSRALAELLDLLRPDAVLTHAYEGGHPDHDATGFAVQAACGLLEAAGGPTPLRLELASYHGLGGAITVLDFLPRWDCRVLTLPLSDGERRRKQQMYDCFVTQRQVLAAFPIDLERFRPAPRYDFTIPPHPGPLYYDHFDWGITAAGWCRAAREAVAALEAQSQLPSPERRSG